MSKPKTRHGGTFRLAPILGILFGVFLGMLISGNFLAWFFASVVLASVVGGVVGGVAVLVGLIIFSPKPEPEQPVVETIPDDRLSSDKVRNMIASLLSLNERARLLPCSPAVLENLESVIDLLRDLLPEVNENYPGQQSAWFCNKVTQTYLPGFMDKYFAISPDASSSGGYEEDVLTNLRELKDELLRMKSFVDQDKARDFVIESQNLRLTLKVGDELGLK